MKNKFCGKCGAEIDPAKKFCGKCGTPIRRPAASGGGDGEKKSPDADPATADEAKAGTKDDSGVAITATRSEVTNKSCIYWDVRPELVAQRLEETQMDHYGVAQGIIIHEGTRALIYSAGDYVGEFTSGKYTLLSPKTKSSSGKSNENLVRQGGVLDNLKEGAKKVWSFLFGEKVTQEEADQKKAQEAVEKKQKKSVTSEQDKLEDDFIRVAEQGKPFTIVLARDGEFSLVFNYKGLETAEVRSDISLQLRVKITDLKAFYREYLQDHLTVTMNRLQTDLAGIVDLEVGGAIKRSKIGDIGQNRDLQDQLATAINQELQRTMEFMSVTRVFKVTAKREEIEKLRQMAEELYLADKELDQRLRADEFQHRVRLADNNREILKFKDAQSLDVEMKKLNKDKILSDEDFERFKKRVQLDSQLADAENQEEREAVLIEYEKNKVLRQDELELLRAQTEMNRGYSLELLEISNRIQRDTARLQWEHEVGDAQIQLEVDRNRRDLINQAEFVDLEWDARSRGTDHELEDRGKRDKYGDTRRDAEREQEAKDTDEQIRTLKGLKEIKDDTDQKEHDRDMAELKAVQDAKQKTLETKAGMSDAAILAEQGLQSEAAVAKAKAEAEIAARDDRGKEADKRVADMKDMMDMVKDMATKSMETTATAAGAQATQKDEQLKREERRSTETTEAVTNVTGSAASAVGEGIKGKSQGTSKCVNPECGAAIETGSDFCTSCGTKQS